MIAAACVFVAMNLPGGSIAAHERHIAALDAAGCRVEIRGECLSACTMYLGAQSICVDPRARLGFHHTRRMHLGGLLVRPMKWDDQDHYDRRMAAFYPPAVRQWFLDDVRHRGFSAWGWLRGEELVRQGVADCD